MLVIQFIQLNLSKMHTWKKSIQCKNISYNVKKNSLPFIFLNPVNFSSEKYRIHIRKKPSAEHIFVKHVTANISADIFLITNISFSP